jgi:hypothetical protein
MKASPLPLIRAHYATLVDARNGRVMLRDYLAFAGLPVAAFAACWACGVHLPVGASVGLLTVAGLLSAFLFGVMLQVSERAMDWVDGETVSGPETTRQAIFLEEIAANAGYASLVSILTAAVFVVASASPHTDLALISAIGIGLAVHLALVQLW